MIEACEVRTSYDWVKTEDRFFSSEGQCERKVEVLAPDGQTVISAVTFVMNGEDFAEDKATYQKRYKCGQLKREADDD